MEKLTIYKAKDGVRFDVEKDCAEYEKLIDRVEAVICKLRPHEDVDTMVAIQQNINTLRDCFKTFLVDICAPLFPSYGHLFISCAEGKTHKSWPSRILADNDYPVLRYTMWRFECIDMETGIEYEQPYFAYNPKEFKGTVI